jgi:hexosaminidase
MASFKSLIITLGLYVAVLLMPALSSATAQSSIDVIIPKPQKLIEKKGSFLLGRETRIFTDTALSGNAIRYLQRQLSLNSGYTLQKSSELKRSVLQFHYNPKEIEKPEAYRLHINQKKIFIEARDKAGFFYGVITLMQLLDPSIWRQKTTTTQKLNWQIPACVIEDYPRFEWRGMMLDSARNFFSKAYIKKFIDRMAQQKLNRFHWHLTDDEGWRIQIKRYPLLTEIGAKRGPGTKLPFSSYPAMRGPKNRQQSGYYSQQDIREIVAYAKARSIEILPEIDLPGHAKAAVVSYPKLLQDPRDKSHYRSVQRVSNNTIDPGMKSSYLFLENVITEVAALFPFGYIHLGGDEVPRGAWQKSPAVKRLMQKRGLKTTQEVENYFFHRMDKILARHHRKMIAWQEVLKGKAKLRKDNIFMAWKSPDAGIRAIKKHRNIIMAPVQYLYFDQQYARSKNEPGHTWSTPVSTRKTYSFHPPSHSSYLRGVEACLWSETLLNEGIADYLAWPRSFALAELAWTEEKYRNWKNFKKRAYDTGLQRLKAQDIRYRKLR